MDDIVSRPVAAIDIGSNSIRLLIQKPTPRGWVTVFQDRQVVRLGSRDEGDRIPPARINHGARVLTNFRQQAEKREAGKIAAVATAALRTAANGGKVRSCLEEALGTEIRVISGSEEADLTYQGATRDRLEEKPWVIDIGGGSTELIGPDRRGRSLNLGALSLLEKKGEGNFTAMEKEARGFFRKQLSSGAYKPLIGVGGTIANLAAIKKEVLIFTEEKVHGTKIEREWLQAKLEMMKGMAPRERKQIKGLERGREDIIVPGALILKSFLTVHDIAELFYSDRDILHGIIISEWAQQKSKGKNSTGKMEKNNQKE